MAEKFLIRDAATGEPAEKQATQISTGLNSAGEIPALRPDGKLDESLLPETVGGNVRALAAAEALQPQDLVYIGNNNGSPGIFRATGAVGGHPASGFVKKSASAGETVNVYFEGIVAAQSNLEVGETVFLAENLGGSTQTPLQGEGKLSQVVGEAISNSEYSFEAGVRIKLA